MNIQLITAKLEANNWQLACLTAEERALAAMPVSGWTDAKHAHTLEKLHGAESMPFREWVDALDALGYRVNLRDSCDCNCKIMTGPLAGLSYPTRSYTLTHKASGLSAFHVDCPRGPEWAEVTELRQKTVLSPNGKNILSV